MYIEYTQLILNYLLLVEIGITTFYVLAIISNNNAYFFIQKKMKLNVSMIGIIFKFGVMKNEGSVPISKLYTASNKPLVKW